MTNYSRYSLLVIGEIMSTKTTANLEYISEKQFWVMETPSLPMLDWDLVGADHPEEACTILSREEVVPRLEEYCATHPGVGFYVEKTPGGVRAFYNQPLTLEEWRTLAAELGCDPLMSQLQEGWWTPRVSPKPGQTWTSEFWLFLGSVGSNHEDYEKYRAVVEELTKGCWTDTLYVRKHSTPWSPQQIIWTQVEGWAEARLGYGEHLFIVKIQPIDLKHPPQNYLMGNTDCVSIPYGYTYGVEDLEKEYGGEYKGIHWVSIHSDLVKSVEYVGEDPTYQAEVEAWQTKIAQLAQAAAATQAPKPKKSILEQIKEKWGNGSKKSKGGKVYFTYNYISFVYHDDTQMIYPTDEIEDEEEKEYIKELITEMWSELNT